MPPALQHLKVAFAHDWLVTWRGGEKVLAAMVELFPDAPIATLFHEKGSMPAVLEHHPITTSWLDAVPLARSKHRYMLPLMPAAIRTLRLDPVDVVVSSSHCVAKAIPVPPGARHLSYVHAPLRYMWDRFGDYFGPGRAPAPVRLAARVLRPAFRAWDVTTARSVDRFSANTRHVARQISERYARPSRVLHPPVELERFTSSQLSRTGTGDYFLCLGALAPYKRLDLAIDAFRKTGQTLWIAGSGQSTRWLRNLPKNVRALGQVPDEELPALYRNARALIFPGVEDFGITPLEAQASGRPVIAFAQGGALETVTPRTGVFFPEQSVDALVEALRQFERFERTFQPSLARDQALRFGLEGFQAGFIEELEALVSAKP